MSPHDVNGGNVTPIRPRSRAEVCFELDESEALSDAYEHLLSLGVDAEAHPLFRGLRRIHQAEAIERQG